MFEAFFATHTNSAAFTRFPAIAPDIMQKRSASVRVEGVLLEANQPVIVGREGAIQVFQQVSWISRKHLEVKVDEEGNLWARDLHSKHGTYINRDRIDSDWNQVRANDVLWLGRLGTSLTITRQ